MSATCLGVSLLNGAQHGVGREHTPPGQCCCAVALSLVRYLTLSADYGAPRLRDADDRDGSTSLDDIGLPSALVDDLTSWNAEYEEVIPLDTKEREGDPASALIDRLDQEGMALAVRVAEAVGSGAKVAYYSEGRLRSLL